MANPAEITQDEYRARTAKVQQILTERGCDALFLTSEDNVQYLTGYRSPAWNNLTRPRYLIVPARGEPIIISTLNYVVIIEETTWIKDIRTWIAPNPEDEGISTAVDALRSVSGKNKKIAAELGQQSRLDMPAGDFLKIRDGLRGYDFIDGHEMLMKLRMVKSQGEIDRIRIAAAATSHGFSLIPKTSKKGDSLFSIAQGLKKSIIAAGAEDVPYVIGVADQGGYPCVNLAPDHKPLKSGDVCLFDIAARYDGYYCDFDRDFVVGEPTPDIRSNHRKVWDATQAGIEAIKPGRRLSDVWRAMAEVLGVDAVRSTGIGRMGHSVGLRMCEEPSLSERDHTVIEENMVLTLEPGIVVRPAGQRQRERRVVVHEENVVVTKTGSSLLSVRTPEEIPVIPL
jgi:Xaa-Pro aminopeptidase